MSTDKELFKSAALAAKSLCEKPDDSTLLQLYARCRYIELVRKLGGGF
jgi:acyl-CoA-binding protein